MTSNPEPDRQVDEFIAATDARILALTPEKRVKLLLDFDAARRELAVLRNAVLEVQVVT